MRVARVDKRERQERKKVRRRETRRRERERERPRTKKKRYAQKGRVTRGRDDVKRADEYSEKDGEKGHGGMKRDKQRSGGRGRLKGGSENEIAKAAGERASKQREGDTRCASTRRRDE